MAASSAVEVSPPAEGAPLFDLTTTNEEKMLSKINYQLKRAQTEAKGSVNSPSGFKIWQELRFWPEM